MQVHAAAVKETWPVHSKEEGSQDPKIAIARPCLAVDPWGVGPALRTLAHKEEASVVVVITRTREI